MEVEAKARYMRIPPRKARLVAATVIGMPVKDALVVLNFTPKAAAQEIGKVVKSAAANATNNFSQDEDSLVVKRIIVNEGPTLKRGRPRARGMYFSVFKRTSHITAIVEAVEQEPRRRARRTTAAAVPPAKPARAPKAEQTTKTEVEEPTTSEVAVEENTTEEVSAATQDQHAVEAEAEDTPVTPEEATEDAPAVSTKDEKENA
jgi:large subunit ribosomal protein L22